VFEPFVTTKPEGQGTGLGLSTVLMVVERHQGRIDFTTSPSGTTFRISLPAAVSPPS
jgi:signal transduction histidine kinase